MDKYTTTTDKPSIELLDDILHRNYNKPISTFSQEIIAHICTSIQALRGVLFIREEDHLLKAAGGYACTFETLEQHSFTLGQGLIGQAAKSLTPFFIEDIPEKNILMTSGLTQLSAACLSVIPLHLNGYCYGVIELTTLHNLNKEQTALLALMAHKITPTLQSIQHQQHTNKLLEDAQLLTEQLRTQEEELRQNLEELNASQEFSKEQQEALERSKNQIRAFMDSSQDYMLMFDKSYTILLANQFLITAYAQAGIPIVEGKSNLQQIYQERNWDAIYPYIQKALKGDICQFEYTYELPEYHSINHLQCTLSPIIEQEEVIAVAMVAHDYSKLQRSIQEARQRSEELLTLEEELRQNLEELHSSQEHLREQHQQLEENSHFTSALLNSIAYPIILTDTDLKILYANEAYLTLIRQRNLMVDLKETTMYDLYTSNQLRIVQPYLEQALQGKNGFFDLPLERDGKIKIMRTHFSAVLNQQGQVHMISVLAVPANSGTSIWKMMRTLLGF